MFYKLVTFNILSDNCKYKVYSCCKKIIQEVDNLPKNLGLVQCKDENCFIWKSLEDLKQDKEK